MVYHIIVSFGRERQYEFKFSHTELAAGSPEEARRWFDKEFADLECEPSNPMGKVLIIDKILNVARYGGEQRFIDRQGLGDALCPLHGPGARARHRAHRRGRVQYRLLMRLPAAALGSSHCGAGLRTCAVSFFAHRLAHGQVGQRVLSAPGPFNRSMNKAFTKESDDGRRGAGRRASIPRSGCRRERATTSRRAGTRASAELDHLLRVERPQVVERRAVGGANGDRSENADYIYGKRRLREIDRRIRFLTRRLDLAEIVDPAGPREHRAGVSLGRTVTICDEQGMESTYQIVGVDETDSARGRISWVSPLARALLKSRAGDAVRFRVRPAGARSRCWRSSIRASRP
jgi:transcription elongation factor GreB